MSLATLSWLSAVFGGMGIAYVLGYARGVRRTADIYDVELSDAIKRIPVETRGDYFAASRERSKRRHP